MKIRHLRFASPVTPPRREVLVAGIIYFLAVLPALFGLPLRAGAPIHHYILACPVVAAVVVANVRCARRATLRPLAVGPWASLAISAPVALILYMSAFHAVIADQDNGLDFVAALAGIESRSVRSALILLVALFMLVVTVTPMLAFAVKEHAADTGSSTTADDSDADTSTATSAVREASERATVKSTVSRKTPAHRQTNGVNDNQPGQSSPPSSARAKTQFDPAEPSAKPAEARSSAAEHHVSRMVDGVVPDTAGATQPVLPARRMLTRKIVWAGLCLALVVAFLTLAQLWNAQAVTDGGCKPAVLEKSVQIGGVLKLSRPTQERRPVPEI